MMPATRSTRTIRQALVSLEVAPARAYDDAFGRFLDWSFRAQMGDAYAMLHRGMAAVRIGDYATAFHDAQALRLFPWHNARWLMVRAGLGVLAQRQGVLPPGPGLPRHGCSVQGVVRETRQVLDGLAAERGHAQAEVARGILDALEEMSVAPPVADPPTG